MRIALRNLCVVAVTFLLMCCKDMSNSPIIQVKDVREVDYFNKTGDVIEGTFIREIMGGQGITICDTLLFAFTSNPEGMLEVYSVNNLQHKLASLCKRGRAENEISMLSIAQVYKKDNHYYMLLEDAFVRFCEIDITESLEKGYTVVTRTKMRQFNQLGHAIFLNNDIDYALDYIPRYYHPEIEDDTKYPHVKYTLVKGDKHTELKFFNAPTQVADEGFVDDPYYGGVEKHPSKNIVVNYFSYMDYILFMDFDKNHNFVVHQQGATTHEDLYINKEPWIRTFTSCLPTEEYVFIFYRDGEYANILQEDNTWHPELLVFDWEGNYIKGFKMDRNSISLAYDEKNKTLYTFTTQKEQLYAYDLSGLLP